MQDPLQKNSDSRQYFDIKRPSNPDPTSRPVINNEPIQSDPMVSSRSATDGNKVNFTFIDSEDEAVTKTDEITDQQPNDSDSEAVDSLVSLVTDNDKVEPPSEDDTQPVEPEATTPDMAEDTEADASD